MNPGDSLEMNTWIGTSGFQYKEWKGSFYPEKLSLPKMLAFYATQFNSTEINYTFRSLPSEKTIARWMDETPDNFRFSLKAPQRVTHFAKLRKCGEAMNEFRQAVKGLGKKLGPVLFQLPETFRGDAVLLQEFLSSLPKLGPAATWSSSPTSRRASHGRRSAPGRGAAGSAVRSGRRP